MLRDRQLLVVDDDKQLSPSAVSIEERIAIQLREAFLKGTLLQSSLDPKSARCQEAVYRMHMRPPLSSRGRCLSFALADAGTVGRGAREAVGRLGGQSSGRAPDQMGEETPDVGGHRVVAVGRAEAKGRCYALVDEERQGGPGGEARAERP